MPRRTLTASEAKAVYDRFGAKQDSQAFYEDAAIAQLIRHGAFESATQVFEFGCGTGRVAERLLRDHLPPAATYEAVDLSTTMVRIATTRLAPFGSRVVVREGSSFPSASVDRIVTTYVLDLLADEEIAGFVRDSARALNAGGRLCIANLTSGRTFVSRIVTAIWKVVFRISPRLVGGCRPIRVRSLLDERTWLVLAHEVVTAFGVASEVVVAERKAT